jgi:hypothetical protein
MHVRLTILLLLLLPRLFRLVALVCAASPPPLRQLHRHQSPH